MPAVPAAPLTPQGLADLRLRAASRLSGIVGGPVSASGALAVLHDLAASPDTASDALAVLHELQVHQVEVDLQAEALRESRAELEAALHRQVELYDALPVACFTIDRALVVHELNRVAASLLGVAHDEALGVALDHFLTPECELAVRRLVSNAAPGQAGGAPTLQLIMKQGTERRVQAHASADPAGKHVLLVLVEAGDLTAGGGG